MASLTLDWLHVIVLLGAIQGAFLAVALTAKRRNRTANRLLAAAMLAFSLGLTTSVYHASGYVTKVPHFFGVGYPVVFLYGPLIYLYAVAAADRSHRLTRKDVLHFVPFIATVLGGANIYLLSGPEKVEFYDQLVAGEGTTLLIQVADPLKFVSGIAYTIATIVFLRRHRERVKESYSSTERVNLRWLLWLGGAAAAVWTLAIVTNLLELAGILRVTPPDDIIGLAVSAFVYAIGYMGLRQPEVFRFETAEYPVQSLAATAPAPVVSAPIPESDAASYERSGLTEAEARRLKAALLGAMGTDAPWKNSELTLADLAERLGTTPHKLSEVLNVELGQTFYDFVNGYRVREVQRRIKAGEAKVKKILALALDAGFASKSTFNEVFKKHTSQTPSDFRVSAGA